MTDNAQIQCQMAVVVKDKVAHRRMRRQCSKNATYNVTVHVNGAVKPLVADNYDTTQVYRDYFVCGVHKNKMVREFPSRQGEVWHAAVTALPKYIR